MLTDVSFPKGLGELARAITAEIKERETMVFMTAAHFSAVAVSRHMVRRVGVFDEALWPAYVEDCDLMMRVRLEAGGGVTNVTGGHMYYDKFPVAHASQGQVALLSKIRHSTLRMNVYRLA